MQKRHIRKGVIYSLDLLQSVALFHLGVKLTQ